MTEQAIVKESLIEVFKKNGYIETGQLTQRDFDHISHQIETATGTLISGSTVKRLLHGEFSRLPQIATLDAISRYLGYTTWQEYRSARRKPETFIAQEAKQRIAENKNHTHTSARVKGYKLIALVCLAIGAIAIVVFVQFTQKKQFQHMEKASFSARRNTNHDLPNTVVFNYNVDEVIADSFFIQQSWDTNKRVRISKNNYTLTDIYYEPGYHIAKLIANDSVIRTIDISIPTDRWFLFAKDNPGSKPEYIKADHCIRDGFFGLSEKDILANKIDIGKEKEYLYTFFPGKLEVSSDKFVLKTRVRMKEVKNNNCPYITMEVFCQRYAMFFKTTSKGCSSESMLQFGEQFISGKESDLASLGFDVTQWMDMEVIVKNKQANIIINNQPVFSTSYKNTSRLIAGLGFVSNGLCEVDFVELKGIDGTVVYANGFDSENQ
ncbi:hypothetical protein GXP67_20245 [Rhodocytophaga rosea]|uniref:Uncharacterized protein n=1 Tax=Rhodocytophaga rosea TaxID=2704465 RepID=A0A6C0GMG1_9BACT|nr:hypothetical protein [Rhodocytophaga rosea]QHT68813.1 hypothetical protein GXP67_20245 [Rhodocytophaga rosea]